MNTDLVRNDKLIDSNIDKEAKKFNNLDKIFSKLLKQEKSIKDDRIKAFEDLNKIDEENLYLQDMYKNFKQSMIDLEKARQNKIEKLERTIVPSIRYYPTKIKTFKRPLNSLKDLSKSIDNQDNKIQKAKTKSDVDAIRMHEEQKIKINHEKLNLGKNLEKELVEFEAMRIDDNKSILLHYIHSELAYHANVMQSLSKLYQEINILEPKEKLKNYIHKYNLNSLRDLNLEDKYKFKDGESERKINLYKNKIVNNNVDLNNNNNNNQVTIQDNKGKI